MFYLMISYMISWQRKVPDDRACHFFEESLEEVTVLTSKRRSRSCKFQTFPSHFQVARNTTFSIGFASGYGLFKLRMGIRVFFSLSLSGAPWAAAAWSLGPSCQPQAPSQAASDSEPLAPTLPKFNFGADLPTKCTNYSVVPNASIWHFTCTLEFQVKTYFNLKLVLFHQQIGVKLLPIIGFTPQLLAIIGNYLQLLLLLVYKKGWLLLTFIAPCSNINLCNYCKIIIAINHFC
jgi:hypothetical protein